MCCLQIRPNPALFPGVKTPGPFLLGGNTKVPAPINMHLRDYQREGVEFLFRQYKEGRGGWLGDDMGLASSFDIPICSSQLICFVREKPFKLSPFWPPSCIRATINATNIAGGSGSLTYKVLQGQNRSTSSHRRIQNTQPLSSLLPAVSC